MKRLILAVVAVLCVAVATPVTAHETLVWKHAVGNTMSYGRMAYRYGVMLEFSKSAQEQPEECKWVKGWIAVDIPEEHRFQLHITHDVCVSSWEDFTAWGYTLDNIDTLRKGGPAR